MSHLTTLILCTLIAAISAWNVPAIRPEVTLRCDFANARPVNNPSRGPSRCNYVYNAKIEAPSSHLHTSEYTSALTDTTSPFCVHVNYTLRGDASLSLVLDRFDEPDLVLFNVSAAAENSHVFALVTPATTVGWFKLRIQGKEGGFVRLINAEVQAASTCVY